MAALLSSLALGQALDGWAHAVAQLISLLLLRRALLLDALAVLRRVPLALEALHEIWLQGARLSPLVALVEAGLAAHAVGQGLAVLRYVAAQLLAVQAWVL